MSWRGQDKDRQTQARGNTIRPRFTAALTASSVRKDRKSRESGIQSRTAGRGQVRLPGAPGPGSPWPRAGSAAAVRFPLAFPHSAR